MTSADACMQRGDAHVAQQQWQAALDCYREAARLDPNHAQAHAFVGNVLRQLRQPDAAMAAYDRAIAVKPDYAEVYYNRGALLHQARQLHAALESYDTALSINSSFPEAHSSRGDVLRELGRLDEAKASYDSAIAIAPGQVNAHAGRGLVLLARMFGNRALAESKLGRLAEARASHEQAVLLDPRDAALHFNRGAFLSDRKEWQEAVRSYQAAISLKPDYAEAYSNLGLAQQETGHADAAVDSYSRALAINPRLTTALVNRGNIHRSRRQYAEALLDLRQALALDPNSAEAHYNIAMLALLQGDLAAGWPGYEWRGLIEEARAIPSRELPQPAWFGEFPLKGKHIFLHAEQGLGDTIQFCRYAGLVAALGAQVTLEVQPTLSELLANLDGVSELVSFGSPIPPADYQCSLMSLPGAFRTTLETIPCRVPYLHADPLKVTRCREILGPATRPRIGLAWSGNPRHSSNHLKSVPLAALNAYLPKEFDYFCLQNQMNDADRETLRSCTNITTVETLLKTLNDTAALIETLDLVISVDTSIAHLSGALGRRTWILLPFFPDWRWLMDRRDSPWYPTATLYRQPAANDWDSTLAEVHRELLR